MKVLPILNIALKIIFIFGVSIGSHVLLTDIMSESMTVSVLVTTMLAVINVSILFGTTVDQYKRRKAWVESKPMKNEPTSKEERMEAVKERYGVDFTFYHLPSVGLLLFINICFISGILYGTYQNNY